MNEIINNIINNVLVPGIIFFVCAGVFVYFYKFREKDKKNNYVEPKQNYRVKSENSKKNEFFKKYGRELNNNDLNFAYENTQSSDFNILMAWLFVNETLVNNIIYNNDSSYSNNVLNFDISNLYFNDENQNYNNEEVKNFDESKNYKEDEVIYENKNDSNEIKSFYKDESFRKENDIIYVTKDEEKETFKSYNNSYYKDEEKETVKTPSYYDRDSSSNDNYRDNDSGGGGGGDD